MGHCPATHRSATPARADVAHASGEGEPVTDVRHGPGRRRPFLGLRPRVPGRNAPVARPAPREPASANGRPRPPVPAERRRPVDRPPPDEAVRYGLRLAAGYAWRSVAVAIAVYLVFVALGRVSFVAVSVFVGLLITALLRPLTDLLARRLPRGVAVGIALLQAVVVVSGVVTFVATSAVGQFGRLIGQLASGIREIEALLSAPPLRLPAGELNRLAGQAVGWLTENRGELAVQAAGEARVVAELFTGLALAVFCSLFFLHSGERMWAWVLAQLPVRRPRWDAAARAGWTAFAGYTRGVVFVAVSNATLVGIALTLLKVPLALPLSLLVLLGAFIPLIGAPIALAFATLVALAGRGPLTALAVLVLIVVIGQIEGHVLQPMIMSRAVKLHPVVVAVSVASGTVLAGIIGAVVAVPMVAVAWATFAQLRVSDPDDEGPDPRAPEPREADPPPPDAPVTEPVVP
jgi:putative heme transporter